MTDTELLWAMTGSDRGWHSWDRVGREHPEFTWVPDRAAFTAMVDRHGYTGDLAVSLVPVMSPWERFRGHGSVLWVKTQSRDSVERLARFRPQPTLVLREGRSARVAALWAISEALPVPKVERANKRLAYALRCVQKHGGAGGRVFVPGTVLRRGRKRPAVVTVDGGTRDLYRWGPLVGGLKDPPPPDAWRERAA